MRVKPLRITNHSKAAAAFTLIEVLTAIGIVGIVSVSLYAGLAMSFEAVHNSRLELRATHILTEKLEAIRLFNWDQVKTEGFIPQKFNERFDPANQLSVLYEGELNVDNASVASAYDDTMRKVVARVTWNNTHGKCTKQMETLISKYGIQNYLY